jgi:hypothetical protein
MRRAGIALLLTALAALYGMPGFAGPPACKPYEKLKLSPEGTLVRQLCANKAAQTSLRNVLIGFPGVDSRTDVLKLGQRLEAATTIAVPPSTYIDLADARARVHASPGTVIVVGKEYEIDGSGRAEFAVLHNALDLFRVNVGRFAAAVQGTVFAVDTTAPDAVRFSVSNGRISVTRLATITLLKERLIVAGMRASTVVNAGDPPASYARTLTLSNPDTLASYNDVNDARAKITAGIAAANAAGDPLRAEDASENLKVLNEVKIPHVSVIDILTGLLRDFIIINDHTNNSGTRPPWPTPTTPPTPRGRPGHR